MQFLRQILNIQVKIEIELILNEDFIANAALYFEMLSVLELLVRYLVLLHTICANLQAKLLPFILTGYTFIRILNIPGEEQTVGCTTSDFVKIKRYTVGF